MAIQTKNDLVTTTEAAVLLGFTPDYVRQLVLAGKIRAEKFGNVWAIRRKDIAQIKRQRRVKET